MDDLGNVLTDKELTKLENRIKKEYRQAVLEIQAKFDDYMKKYAEQDAKKVQEVKEGKITFRQYRLWRKNKILRNKHYEELRNKLVNDLLNADKKAVSYINDTLPNIYATNINYETFNAEKETLIDTSFTLYNEDTVRKLIKENPQLLPIKPNLNIPKDLLWNKRHINSAITQGILQGEGIPKIAKRLERATNMDRSVAIRNARTCVTSAQNAGRLDAMKRERDMGIAIKKVWLATLDSRTRDSHVALDGEERELEENFSNGLIAPANDGGVGKPDQCYNCRCRLGRQFDKYRTDWTNLENRRHDKLGNMSYEQWKEEHRKHAEEVAERRKKKMQAKGAKNG
jgi:SPP1 gp7 family putative phage head morphogenesis protein